MPAVDRVSHSNVGAKRQARWAQQRAITRQAIVASAHRLFREQGFLDTTIAQIAQASGVCVQTVFNHANCKEELFFLDRNPPPTLPWPPPPGDGQTWQQALATTLTVNVMDHLRLMTTPQGRDLAAQIQANPPLARYELALHGDTETLLAQHLRLHLLAEQAEYAAALLMTTIRIRGRRFRAQLLSESDHPCTKYLRDQIYQELLVIASMFPFQENT